MSGGENLQSHLGDESPQAQKVLPRLPLSRKGNALKRVMWKPQQGLSRQDGRKTSMAGRWCLAHVCTSVSISYLEQREEENAEPRLGAW